MASTSKTKKTKGSLARFLETLWAMVDDEDEIEKCSKYISWNESGTGIIIKSRNELASHVLPTYFNTHDFASFHRQLTNYGFKKLQDVERDEFVNENFRRGFPELRKKIIKKKPPDKHRAGCSSDRSCVMQKGSRVYEESLGQSYFSTLVPRNPQDPTPSERLTAKRPQKQMTSQENVPSNQKLKKLKASEVRLTDPATRSPLRSLVTASSVERSPYQANYSPRKEGPFQELLIGNSEEIDHPNSGTQEARNDTVSFAPHTVFELLEEPVDNMPIGYSTPQMNYLSNMSNATSTVQLNQSFHPGNTGMAGDSLWVPSQQPLGMCSQCPSFDDYQPKNDALDSEIDLTEIIPLFHDSMGGPTPDLAALSSQSSVDSSLTSQAFINVGLHNQNPTENTIQIHEPPEAMQTQVSHGGRGRNSSDSGLGSHSSGSFSHSRDTSDIENSTLEEYPIIKIRPDAVGLSGAPSCVFLGLSELCPGVQSGYATVESLEQKIQWVKDDKDGRGDCIPPSPEAGKKLVQIYSESGEKLAEAELLYVDPCHHKDEDCFERVIDIASRSPADLCRFMSNLYIHIRDQATVKSGDTQYSGNFGSSQNVQVLWLLFYKAAESGFQWDSLPLAKFDAMNHDHESAARYLEEITERFTKDVAASEGPESIDWFEVLSAIITPLEQDEAKDASEDERLHPEDCKDSDSSYYGDVESLSCDLAQPTSDSEDDLSEVFSKDFAIKENELQLEEHIAEKDESDLIYQPFGDLSEAQLAEKETRQTGSRPNEITAVLQKNVTKGRMSDKQVTRSSYQQLPFRTYGKFSSKQIAFKRGENPSKHMIKKHCLFQVKNHFHLELRNLAKMKSVDQPIISSLLTINTESISRYLSTMHERWAILLHLQRFSGLITAPSISVLFQRMSLDPAEVTLTVSLTKPENTTVQALNSLHANRGLSLPSDKTSEARWKTFDYPQKDYPNTASDVLVLTSIYRPTKRILLSCVADRKVDFPPDLWFEDEDCELLMECWKWRRCKNELRTEKRNKMQEQPDISSEERTQEDESDSFDTGYLEDSETSSNEMSPPPNSQSDDSEDNFGEEFYETAKAGERQPATELQEKLNLSSKLRPVETVMGINRGWKACCDQVEDTKASLKSLSDCNLATDGEISPPVDPPSDLIKVSSYREASSPGPSMSPPNKIPVVSRLPTILSTTECPGAMGFQISFGSLTQSAAWTYSDVCKKLYVNWASYCPIKFKTNMPPSQGTILRAVAVFKGSTNLHDVVKRCSNHIESSNDGSAPKDQFILSNNPAAHYHTCPETMRDSVVLPYNGPQVGTEYVTEMFAFMCFSSCISRPSRRPVEVIFTLEKDGQTLGRRVVEIKVCACPVSDRKSDERAACGERGSSQAAGMRPWKGSGNRGPGAKRDSTDEKLLIPISRYFEASTQDPFLPFPDMLGVVSRLPIIPSTTEYPGHMGFQVSFGTLTESASESSTWTYSDVYKRLYVNLASYCAIKFKTNKPPPRGTILRAVAVFKGSTNIHDVVKRCPIHMESSNDGSAPKDQFILSNNPAAHYHTCPETMRDSVVLPYNGPQVGTEYVTEMFAFMCFSRCSSGPTGRPVEVIFTLEKDGQTLSRRVVEIRVCACPGRDRKSDERAVCGEPSSSQAARKLPCIVSSSRGPGAKGGPTFSRNSTDEEFFTASRGLHFYGLWPHYNR